MHGGGKVILNNQRNQLPSRAVIPVQLFLKLFAERGKGKNGKVGAFSGPGGF